jgi:hypothetical protein
MNDLEMQQYLFDLQGYLVVENVLSSEEVAELNGLMDNQDLPAPDQDPRFGAAAGGAPEGPGFLQWGKPFCDLLDHAGIMEVLRFRLGDCFRLDRLYGMRMWQGMGRGGLHSDYGASSFTAKSVPGQRYHAPDTEMVNGFVVVGWNLSDTGPEHGGFCCIPGSHKSDYRIPQAIPQNPEEWPCVVTPSIPAGSALLFTESLTHGTAAWNGAHQRRTLLFKYCIAQMAWSSRRVRPPQGIELTQRQRLLLAEPADPYRFFPSLFEDKKA